MPNTPISPANPVQPSDFMKNDIPAETDDLELGRRNPEDAEPIEPQLAADGVSEFFDEVLPGLSKDLDGPAQTISLRANDREVQWIMRTGHGQCEAVPSGSTVDAAVSADASELLLLLWGRQNVDQVRVDGDVTALRRFLARASF